jgi:hypothetical protein
LAAATAVTVTVAGEGGALGAVYSPLELMAPTVELPPATPFTCHVTRVFVEKATVAVNCCVAAACTEAVVGLTAMGKATTTLAVPVWVESAAEIAVIVTVALAGTEDGAVYRPLLEIQPYVVLPPVTPFTCQVTLLLLVPDTLALNCLVAVMATVALLGETETETELLPPQAQSKSNDARQTNSR